MESLSMALFGSPPLQNNPKLKQLPLLPKRPSPKPDRHCWLAQTLAKTTLATAIVTSAPLPCSASSVGAVVSEKINLEAILVAIDDFFNRNPFFVAGCTFIWLVAIPLTQEYLRKYKFIFAIDAFRKLRDEPEAQLLDIRDGKSLKYLKSPNLKFLNNKSVAQVQFTEDDTDGFVKKVLAKFDDPQNTVLCILDDLDGDSLKAAELLFKSGFKEAYAIKGGVAGKKGWLEIQEQLLPPSVHILPRKKKKKALTSSELGKENGVVVQSNEVIGKSQLSGDRDTSESTRSSLDQKVNYRSSSPYPNYPDLKPPSSPTPSKPSQSFKESAQKGLF